MPWWEDGSSNIERVHLWYWGVSKQLRQFGVRSFKDNERNKDTFHNIKDEIKEEDKVEADLYRLLQNAEDEENKDRNTEHKLVDGKKYAGLIKSENISLVSSKLHRGSPIFASRI